MTIKPFSITPSSDSVKIEIQHTVFEWKGRVVLLQPRIECTGSDDGRLWYDNNVDVYLDFAPVKTPNFRDDCTFEKIGNFTRIRENEDLQAWTNAMVNEFGIYDIGYNELSEEFLAVLERCLERHIAKN